MEEAQGRKPLSVMETVVELVALGALIWMFVSVARAWHLVPMQVPTHFNAYGVPDQWGPKSSLLIMPGAGLVLYLVLTLLGRLDLGPKDLGQRTEEHARELRQFARLALRVTKAGVVLLFAYMTNRTIQIAMGHAQGLGIGFLLVVLIAPTLLLVVFLVLQSRHL